ncbi:unnamed protein product [Cercopithifilaria johnstoni]|uniref:Ground-like domain-containing protein n=1 Tax=Cercopithifilaria johnstoni TaxID=2874296 RepID=A0A8J2MFA6_9BILA|nr:unnamed protein product [Cercopithifilaria johnstoni]
MFHRFPVIILSFGLLGSAIHGRCITEDCDDEDLRGKQEYQSSRPTRFSSTNCHYHMEKLCPDCGADNCNVDKNIIGDNCWNCCCKQLSLPSNTDDNNDLDDDATVLTVRCEPSSTDCNSKGAEDSGILREGDESSPSLCPSCLQQSRPDSDTPSKKDVMLPVLPKGVPIIPSPQLDLLTSGDSIGFKNIRDLHLSTIKSPSVDKHLLQESSTDNFPSHDCCTRCNSVNCTPRNNNVMILGARIFENRRNSGTKCKNKQLKKLMMANIKKNPTRSKRAIQRAAEQKFVAQFNVVCSKGDFSYVTHATDYCEVSNLGTVCYAFRIH